MPSTAPGPYRFVGFVTFVTVLLVVVILRVAQDVIVPISLSVLLAFLLTPCVNRLARWGLPDPLAIGLAATLSFAVLGGIGWTVATQTVAVLEELPRYEENIRAKVAALKQLHLPGSFSRTKGMVENLQKEVATAPPPEPAGERPKEKTRPPVPVAIAEGQVTTWQVLRQLVTPALGPLGTAGIVIIFVLVILFQRHDLRDRFINLISAGRINMATQGVNDAARRVSRYLGMQLLVNATYGIPVGLGLHLIGVPGAVLWGLLATVLRFIPFLGPWIAAAGPLLLAAAIDPGWTKLLYTAGLFVALELISNNVIEVLVYRATTRISSFALLVAAVFWTWLWDTAGLFLSTPLTVCLLVLGKYVPGLKFLSVLLGSEPTLTPPVLFYQRMLSMNFEQMHELATKYIAERSLTAFYDDVFIPALILAEEDRHSGALAEVRQRFIFQAGRELIEDLSRDDEESNAAANPAPAARSASAPILGIAARDEADELAALMLRHVLRLRGLDVEVSPLTASPSDRAATIAGGKITTTFLSALPPSALVAARQACRQLKTENGAVHVLVGIWSQEARAVDLKPRFRNSEPDEIVTTLAAAAAHLETRGTPPRESPPASHVAAVPPTATKGPRRTARESSPQEVYDRVMRDLAQVFEVPVSLVKIIDADRGFWSSWPWFLSERDIARDALRETWLANTAASVPEITVVENICKDRRFSGNPVLGDRGLCFYAGVPLRLANDRVVGFLCVIDTKARAAGDRHVHALQEGAAALMASTASGQPAVPAKAAREVTPESMTPLALNERAPTHPQGKLVPVTATGNALR